MNGGLIGFRLAAAAAKNDLVTLKALNDSGVDVNKVIIVVFYRRVFFLFFSYEQINRVIMTKELLSIWRLQMGIMNVVCIFFLSLFSLAILTLSPIIFLSFLFDSSLVVTCGSKSNCSR